MKRHFLLISITLVMSMSAFGQVCGGGQNTFRIFVQNGLQAKNPQFQLFAVMPRNSKDDYLSTAKYLNSTFFPLREPVLSRFWIKTVEVRSEIAERFLASYKAEDFKREPPDDDYFRRNKYAGTIEYGEFEFFTGELYDRPLLLKIFADNYKPVYLLGDHFGGCSRVQRVILDEHK